MQLKSRAGALNLDLLRKQDWTISCYTSYPSTTEVCQGTGDTDFKIAISTGNMLKISPTLYTPIPLCQSDCYFCGCNRIVPHSKVAPMPYLDDVARQIQTNTNWMNHDLKVNQHHWGGEIELTSTGQ